MTLVLLSVFKYDKVLGEIRTNHDNIIGYSALRAGLLKNIYPEQNAEGNVVLVSQELGRPIQNCTIQGVTNCTCFGNNFINVLCKKLNYTRLPDITQIPHSMTMESLSLPSNFISYLPSAIFTATTNLRSLDFGNNRISVIEKDAFTKLKYLEVLSLNANPILMLPDFVFSPLISLRVLNLNSASFKAVRVEPFVNLTTLKCLTLNNNSLTTVPMFTYNNMSAIPNLDELWLTENLIETVPWHRMHFFANLQILNLKENRLASIPADALRYLTRLKVLHLEDNILRNGVSHLAFRSNTLEELYFTKSRLHIKNNTQDIFQHATALTQLKTTQCSTDFNVRGLYQNLPHLSYLDMSQSLPIKLDSDIFLNSTNITDLAMNFLSLTQENFGIFSNLVHLGSLYLSNNNIQTINYTSLPARLWKQLKTVDFARNPFVCDCDLVWFRNWLRFLNRTYYIVDFRNMKCSFPPNLRGFRLIDVEHPTAKECFTAHFDWCLLAVFLLIGCLELVSLAASLLYKFRWNIRYLRFRHKQMYREPLESHQFEYDAFVIYSSEDSPWVVQYLHPHLEITGDNLRLCIHDRDWDAGGDITDNITESIDSSRKCLLIISNAFASCSWCHFEMTMAQTRLFENDRNNLILVLLEEIAEINMTPRLHLQMQRQTSIEWTDNEVGQQLFWAKLRQALHQPDLSMINSLLPQSMFAEQDNET